MIVCICNAVREADLRSAARGCCGGAEAVYRCMGLEPQCRQCFEEADEILDEERARAA
ncbi:(2Fe-2S)-binding protein [Croceicoccus mobilis]|uniref:BFD-like [2Fe-2S]-binding domain-containing protein n=1 Tax=Croceicoccus mobilis TaxID=1703339 RepID=A0A916Z5J7_9SPHN|nr:(2Fe-2S)-binding protein [Croceicoccus mobilis]GGD77404.1 hypothetical protein GCM10010990_28900 [Croceicoccus mobilis]